MKRLITTSILVVAALTAVAQSSPYVEPASSIINNSGFKAASIRTVPVTRPTPQHLSIEPLNTTFPERFVVAKADHTPTTWAQACGWNTTANSSSSGATAAIVPTGCAAYFEVGVNAIPGKWRLPTQREMNLITICRFELNAVAGFTPINLAGHYWTSSQVNANSGWAMSMEVSAMSVRSKTLSLWVRCIRDL